MFTCQICNYSTKIKCNYIKHLNTKKHKKRLYELEENDTINKKSIKMTPNDPAMTPNDPKIKKKFRCDYCNTTFSTKAHKRRHEMHKCKNEANPERNNTIKKLEDEKKELYNYIDKLINKVGNTTNNNTINNNNNINIHLNNFGEEDISHLTSQIMTALIKGPCKMIQDAIKFIHFNDSKPENKNICITNVKSKHIKVFKNNKWCYQNKHEAIENIIDKNYNILDDHYEYKGKEELTDFERERYREFQQFFDNQDKKLISKIKDESELLLLNESIVDTKMIEDKKEL